LREEAQMSIFKWDVVYGGKTPPPGAALAPDERLSWGRTADTPAPRHAAERPQDGSQA
jgi:hypothetical protein